MQMDRQTDMTKPIVAFFCFANRPKNEHMAPPPLLPLLLSLLPPPPPPPPPPPHHHSSSSSSSSSSKMLYKNFRKIHEN